MCTGGGFEGRTVAAKNAGTLNSFGPNLLMAKAHGLQELRKRAAAVGIDDAQIEAAREGESPKKDVRCPSAGTGVLWAPS